MKVLGGIRCVSTFLRFLDTPLPMNGVSWPDIPSVTWVSQWPESPDEAKNFSEQPS